MEFAPKIKVVETAESGKERMSIIKKAIFAAFLSSLPTQQTEAASFDIGTSWHAGAVTMEYAMENEPNEFAGLYVMSPNGEGSWHNPMEGDGDSVLIDFEKGAVSTDEYVMKNPSESSFKVCVAHTHPSHTHEEYTYGPSPADFNVDVHFKKHIKENVADALEVKVDVQGMVFERHGVWYYSVNDTVTDEITNETRVEGLTMGHLMNRFKEAIENPEENEGKFTQRLLAIRLALAQKGVKARFVDYDAFFKEPPCAGVNYK